MDSKPRIPNPIIDDKEIRVLSQLESKYNKLTEKNPIIKVGNKALENAGKKGLEQTVFRGILEQLGRYTTLKTTGKSMPIIGGVFGALFDTTQMKKVLDYADIFYHKRFIEEKNVRINYLFDPESVGTVEDVFKDI